MTIGISRLRLILLLRADSYRHKLPNPGRIAVLMQGKLKQHYQSRKEALRNSCFEGFIDVKDLTRLCELLAFQQGKVIAQFEFSKRDCKTDMLSGKINASLSIECQRCLQPMQNDWQLDFHLLIDASDYVVTESDLDTLYSQAGNIDIFEVIEDEIMLAIPLVAMHEDNTCNVYWPVVQHTHRPSMKENPFSILQSLKTI